MENKYISINADNNSDFATITISNDISINKTGKITSELRSAMKTYKNIKITVPKVTSIDLSGIQMFYSIAKTMQANKKEINFEFNFSSDIKKIISETGFENFFKQYWK